MNQMTDNWTIFGADRGQVVQCSYRYDPDTDRIVRRTCDLSDGRTIYDSTPCPESVEWTGAEGVCPIPADLEWWPQLNPFGD